jgi:hypothetical protein
MSARRLFLIFLPTAVCAFAFAPACWAQQAATVDHFTIPVQSYAAIDLSGTSTSSAPIDQMALDDQNNAAFSFWNGANYMTGKSVNGVLVEAPKQTGSTVTTLDNYQRNTVITTLDNGFNRQINAHGDVGTTGGMGPSFAAANVIWPYGGYDGNGTTTIRRVDRWQFI